MPYLILLSLAQLALFVEQSRSTARALFKANRSRLPAAGIGAGIKLLEPWVPVRRLLSQPLTIVGGPGDVLAIEISSGRGGAGQVWRTRFRVRDDGLLLEL